MARTRTSTEGLETPTTSEGAEAPETTPAPTSVPAAQQEEPAEAPVPAVPATLPSGKVAHAGVFRNELEARLFGFRSGVETLQLEMEGQEDDYKKARDTLDTDHASKKADLLRRIDDMRNGESMALAAIDIWNRSQEPAESSDASSGT